MLVKVQTLKGGSFTVTLDTEDTAQTLRQKVAEKLNLAINSVSLICNGAALSDEETLRVRPGDIVLAIPKIRTHSRVPSRPAHLGDNAPEDPDNEEPKFRLPNNTARWVRWLADILQNKLHVPDILLTFFFKVKPRVWWSFLLWMLVAPLAANFGVGELYVLGTIAALIFMNLGSRKAGEASAYSIFNDFQRLPGQLTADELDRQVRLANLIDKHQVRSPDSAGKEILSALAAAGDN